MWTSPWSTTLPSFSKDRSTKAGRSWAENYISEPTGVFSIAHIDPSYIYILYPVSISSSIFNSPCNPASNGFRFHKPRSHIWSVLMTYPLGHVNIAQLPLVVLSVVVVDVVVVVGPEFWTYTGVFYASNPGDSGLRGITFNLMLQWKNKCKHIAVRTEKTTDFISDVTLDIRPTLRQCKVKWAEGSQRTSTWKTCSVCQLPVKKEYNQHKINKNYWVGSLQ